MALGFMNLLPTFGKCCRSEVKTMSLETDEMFHILVLLPSNRYNNQVLQLSYMELKSESQDNMNFSYNSVLSNPICFRPFNLAEGTIVGRKWMVIKNVRPEGHGHLFFVP